MLKLAALIRENGQDGILTAIGLAKMRGNSVLWREAGALNVDVLGSPNFCGG
jgi:hypothetical protein